MEPSPLSSECVVELAREFAPVLLFDRKEPFLPSAVGVSVIDETLQSPSCRHSIKLETGSVRAIEYAVWWDLNIQHLCELEHVWVYLDRDQNVVKIEASARGYFHNRLADDGTLPIRNGRPILFSEPGKHGFFSRLEEIKVHMDRARQSCGEGAGSMNILVQPEFRAALAYMRPFDYFVVRRHLSEMAFEPSFEFSTQFDLRESPLVPWPRLNASIPDRVRDRVFELRQNWNGLKAVFVDSGDTLIDEGSEIWVDGVVQDARPIPGALELLVALKEQGNLVALVADGSQESFDNVHGKLGLTPLFDARAISGTVGVEKPDRRMFDSAAEQLGLAPEDYHGIVHFGNNLRRDIAGANAIGMKTVWINWSERRRKTPRGALEVPDKTVSEPIDLLVALDELYPSQGESQGATRQG